MNNHTGEPDDEKLLRQGDDLIGRGKRSDHAAMNKLANTIPQADKAFQQKLEKLLVAQLHQQNAQNKEINAMQMTTAKASSRVTAFPMWLWAAAVLVITVFGGFALARFHGSSAGSPPFASQVPIEVPPQTIVIATQNIRAGDTISEDMVALISVSNDDFAALQDNEPDRLFFHDLADVVGQVTTTAIFWFEPFTPIKLGQVELCAPGSRYCVTIPEGYSQIDFPHPLIELEEQGLVVGDRVDVLAAVDNQMTVIVRDVLLAIVQPDRVMFASTSWKQSVLVTFWQTHEPYVLRRASRETLTPALEDEARVEYTFTSREALPDGYLFDLIAEFPAPDSYRLSDAPNLDTVQFTQSNETMNFWFTDLDVISITDGTEVVIRLPESDAAALDFLLMQGAELSFVPQSE